MDLILFDNLINSICILLTQAKHHNIFIKLCFLCNKFCIFCCDDMKKPEKEIKIKELVIMNQDSDNPPSSKQDEEKPSIKAKTETILPNNNTNSAEQEINVNLSLYIDVYNVCITFLFLYFIFDYF